MYTLQKTRVGTNESNYCLCIINKQKFSLLFHMLMRTEQGTDLESLPQTEEAWKLMNNTVTQVITFDSKSKVEYEGNGNKVIFQKSALEAYELTLLSEEIAKSFVKDMTKRLAIAEKINNINNSRSFYKSAKLAKRSKRYREKSNVTAGKSRMKLLDIDEETDMMRLRPRNHHFGLSNRGHSVDDLKISLKDYLLETDSILSEVSKPQKLLSSSSFRISGSSIFNRSRKGRTPFVMSESFRTENEYKTNKSEEEKRFLAKCLIDLRTLHGVFLRDFDEIAMSQLVKKAYKITFGVGADIVVLGQIWDEFYVVNEGQVKVIERESSLLKEGVRGKPLDKTRTLTKGDSFGIMCLLNPELSNINAKALTKTTLWALRKNTFETIRTSNIDRQEEKKELFLRKILNQVKIDYVAQDAAHLKNYMDLKILSEGDKYAPPTNDETIVLCFSGLIDVSLEGEFSHSLEENMVHGLKYLEEIHFKGSIPDIAFIANRKSIILLVEAQELRLLLTNLKAKQRQNGKQMSLNSQLPTSGPATMNKLITLFSGLSYRSAGKLGQSKGTMLFSKSGLSVASRPQCIDLEVENVPARIPDMDFYNFRHVSSIGQGNFCEIFVTVYPFEDKEEVYVMKVVSRSGSFDSLTKFNKLNREKQIMAELTAKTNSEFIVRLYHTFADRNNIFYIIEFCCGGDLGQLMVGQKSLALSERTMKFYLACIVLGLEEIHNNHVIYRDMKPDNVFIDQTGYCKIGDFGISKKSHRTYTFWGTLEYQAPEMILNVGYNKSIDIWGLGIVAFELVYGFTPFMAEDRNRPRIILNTVEHKRGGLTKDRIEDLIDEFAPTDLEYPELSDDCLEFVNLLLAPNPARRLGSTYGDGTNIIKAHPFFSTTDWKSLAAKTAPAPLLPEQHDYTATCEGPEISPLLTTERKTRLPDVDTVLYEDQ